MSITDNETSTPPQPPLETLISLEADYGEGSRYGRRILEVTAQQVRVVEEDGTIGFELPIADIKSARSEPLVGGGRLEITTAQNDLLPVVTYSLQKAAQFSEAARGIEQLARGEEFSINLKKERTRCPKCQRLLPEKDGICPVCVHRFKTFRRVAGYLMPYKWHVAGLALLSVLTTIVNLAPPRIQGILIDHVITPHRHLPTMAFLLLLWLGALLANVGLQILFGRLIAFLAAHTSADLRASVFRAVEWLQISFFEKKPTGAIISRITQDTDRVWQFLTEGMPFLLSNALLIIGITVLIFSINVTLAIFILLPTPIVALISGFSWKRVERLSHHFGRKWAGFHANLNETISGIKVVKAFAQEDVEHDRFLRRNHELRDSSVRLNTYWSVIFGAMSFFISLGTLINWTVGGYMVYNRSISLGDFWQVNAYLGLLYGPLQWFASANNWFSQAMAGAERVFEVMDADRELYGNETETVPITGHVEFQNVRFGYDKSNPVLKDINLSVQPGEMIGLVGKSGAGKSTTISLLCRFHEPDSGSIKIDGVDYRNIPLQELRRQVGLVLQEPFLFNGTIAENIAYGKPGACFEEIVAAAKAGNAHQFILSKPDGYDTMTGERGSKLSGGERQRISIARAILHDPRILILDEATSSVDVETEKQMQEAIGRLIQGRTTFAIAHRLATLRNATRLVVLDQGEIVETGTHFELMEKQGVFYNLVKTQSEINEIIGTTA
jgi:ATP-binding cassette subfamily B protein